MGKLVAALMGAAGMLAAVACATGSASSPELVGSFAGNEIPDAAPSEDAISTALYLVRGTVTGVVGKGLLLQNNGADDLSVTGNGSFGFSTLVPKGSAYDVTIKTQPNNPSQTCTVENGKGTATTGDITNVAVTCTANKFKVGGKVTGLVGKNLVIQNKAAGDLTINADGTFTFDAQQDDGASFAVTVKTQPTGPAQTCEVFGGTGAIAGGNVESVLVNCSNSKFAISGTITGLAGTGLVLENNGGDHLNVTSNGTFAFSTPLETDANYAVRVATQPMNRWQTCLVSRGTGKVADQTVSDIAINCTNNKYKVKAAVSGLDGTGLVLQNNLASNLAVTANGTFDFTTEIESGGAYAVTTLTNPTTAASKQQRCTPGANATGTMANGDVTVPVTCTTPGENVVLNAGFEIANANWQCNGNCGFDTVNFARTGTGNGWVRQADGWHDIHQTITVLANRTYLATAWIRTTTNNTDGYFGLRTQGGQVLPGGEKKFASYGPYTQVSFTVNSGNNTRLVVFAGLWANSDRYLQIDDVSVAEQ